jgi:hypothetical protein
MQFASPTDVPPNFITQREELIREMLPELFRLVEVSIAGQSVWQARRFATSDLVGRQRFDTVFCGVAVGEGEG